MRKLRLGDCGIGSIVFLPVEGDCFKVVEKEGKFVEVIRAWFHPVWESWQAHGCETVTMWKTTIAERVA